MNGDYDFLSANWKRLPEKDHSFAQSLLRNVQTPKVQHWVRVLGERIKSPAPVAVAIDVKPILALLQHAAHHKHNPALLVMLPDKRTLRLNIAGDTARVPGSINVATEGGFGNNTWFGRILTDGTFQPSRDCTPEVIEALKAVAVDPVAAARLYGKEIKHCCFCGLTLTDPRSTFVGYGPICADKWGMPWGDIAETMPADFESHDDLADMEPIHLHG